MVDAGGGGAVAEAEETFGGKEELADRAVGAGIDLALEMVEVGVGTGRLGMDLGIASDRNVERRDLLQARDQLGGIGIALRMRSEGAAGLGRVAAQRDEVAHARVPIGARHGIDFVAAGIDAGEMRGGGERRVAHDPLDRLVGALAGRAPCPVGHADEARVERRERLDRLPQGRGHGLGLGREEFEADGDVAARFGEQRRMLGQARFRCAGSCRRSVRAKRVSSRATG